MIYAVFAAGLFFGACGMSALLLLVLGSRKREPPKPKPSGRDLFLNTFRCIDCGNAYPRDDLSWGLCTACQKKATEEMSLRCVTDWDVAQSAQEPEGRVDYRFLGVMGDGQDS